MGANDPPFRFEIRQIQTTFWEFEYAGHMSNTDSDHITRLQQLFTNSVTRVGLLYHVEKFTSFHPVQVKHHGDLFLKNRDKIDGIALVKARTVVRFGATTVGLLSSLELQTFDTRADALQWLESLRK